MVLHVPITLVPVIVALRLRQEDCEFKANLVYKVS
jgi:hypothetical protein